MTVYEKLRHLVVSGALSPTQRVSESRLAELLDVSRTPIREALQRLDGDGLVHSQGRGVRVRILTSDELLHLHDARAGLEGWALATVARRVADGLVPPADLAALRAQADLTHQLTTSGDFDRAVQANRDLHEQAAALAGNPVITQTLRHWWDQIIISTRLSLHSSTRVHEVNAEHLAILNALEAGDVEAARLATETHCRATSDILAAPPSS